MFSLSAIPEPSNNAPSTEVRDAEQRLLPVQAEDAPDNPADSAPTDLPEQDADQQVDGLAVLLLLLIAGGLLRIVLGLLGPLQGVNPTQAELAQQHGKAVVSGDSGNAFPLFDLLAYGSASIGLPAWGLVLLGSLLTLACVPAAYLIGMTLTGRRFAGIIAASVVAVHPAILTAANSYSGATLAFVLVTLGLAGICLVERKGGQVALVGAGLLGAGALAAPLCWLVGLLAGPLTYKLARGSGAGKAFGIAALVVLLGVAPAGAYRVAFVGQDAGALLAELDQNEAADQTTPLQHLLVTMTKPSFTELGEAMHLPVQDAGRLKIGQAAAEPQGERDLVADALADGWLVLNAALAGLAAISIGVMLARRRFAETLLLALPLIATGWVALPPTEALRLPMIALVGVLAMGLFATRSVSRVDEAAREAKRAAKQAKREAKERARQEREVEKHKESLYAFDKPGKGKRVKAKQVEQVEEPVTPGILSEQEEPAPAMSARPI